MDRRSFIKKAGASALAAGTLISQTPAVLGQQQYKWSMVTAWPKNFPGLGTGASRLAKAIETLSGGRISIKVYGAGELVPPFEVFDAVSKGTAQMGHSASYYWRGKIAAAQFFTTVPFGLTTTESAAWLNYGGGQELWDEIYAPFNVKPFPAGNTGTQMGGWFNKEIHTMEDWKGLKMRMPSLGGNVLTKAGATIVNVPGGEIFQSLQSGAIDAAEWVGPFNDLSFGLFKAAKFYYWPGWHEPGSVLELLVNKQEFEKLPQDLREVISQAAKAAYTDMLSEFTAQNNMALGELLHKHKIQLKRFPDPVLEKLAELTQQVMEETAAKDEAFKKVYASFNSFRNRALAWNTIGEESSSIARSLFYKTGL
ncbi:TRAP transporter substrate-binding protein [Deltaproteobacteria bacterium TL4]